MQCPASRIDFTGENNNKNLAAKTGATDPPFIDLPQGRDRSARSRRCRVSIQVALSQIIRLTIGKTKFEEEDEEEDEMGPERRAGIMKAAEFLYELDQKEGDPPHYIPKAERQPPPDPAKPKPAQSAPPTKVRAEPTASEVRAQVTAQIKKALPDLLAANPELARP